MRYVYAHFPITINITSERENKVVEIRNFLGERNVRKVNMLDGVEVYPSKDQKDELIIEGNDVENVSQSGIILIKRRLFGRVSSFGKKTLESFWTEYLLAKKP